MSDVAKSSYRWPANKDGGLPDWYDPSATATRARLELVSHWLGIEPVKLVIRGGEVILSPELIKWCGLHGVSVDWLGTGDPGTLFRAYQSAFFAAVRASNAASVQVTR